LRPNKSIQIHPRTTVVVFSICSFGVMAEQQKSSSEGGPKRSFFEAMASMDAAPKSAKVTGEFNVPREEGDPSSLFANFQMFMASQMEIVHSQQEQMQNMMRAMMSIAETMQQSQGQRMAETTHVGEKVPAAVQNALKKDPPHKLPDIVSRAIGKAANKYEEDVVRYMRGLKRQEKANACMNIFTSSNERDRYPPGFRPFASPEKQVELDTVFDKASLADWNLVICIPAGSTMREALRYVHWEHAKFRAQIEASASKVYLDTAEGKAEKDNFLKQCRLIVEEATKETNDVPGIESIPKYNVQEDLLRDEMERVYNRTIEKVPNDQKKREEKEAKAVEKARLDAEKLVAAQPEYLLDQVVADSNAKAMKEQEKKHEDRFQEEEEEDEDMEHSQPFLDPQNKRAEEEAKQKREEFLQSLQKGNAAPNAKGKGKGSPGLSLGKGKGQHTGKGKADDGTKGKGKGKGKTVDGTKGKGKGQGNGWSPGAASGLSRLSKGTSKGKMSTKGAGKGAFPNKNWSKSKADKKRGRWKWWIGTKRGKF